MRKVHLHGSLGKTYGRTFELEVATAGEAIRALSVNFPGFLQTIRDGAWHIVRGKSVDKGFDLGEAEIGTFRLGKGDLHIVPVVAGSKRSGMLKIVLGVAVAGAAFFLAPAAGGLSAAIGPGMLSGITYGNMAMFGAALALAGASSLLSPEEKDNGDDSGSFTFTGPGNAYAQGSPVPLVYGEVITGGVMISGGMDVERIPVGNGAYVGSYGGKK
ncbi:tail assembly protein [Ancylobacter rudongensis]|uniref:Phage-related protein, tail component n=1 Tax=Ancylobacter rudongensis TaxID=177413 RepID=A0A1G4UPW7_9HYPH|nr:tail assembly protein [Ancylobacter rudongensis]SCW95673.1 Phage-related protein, tail component [Ancylobacter rudongensis]